MPSKNNLNQQVQEESTGKAQSMAGSFRRSGRKARGTRWGTLLNWREGSKGVNNSSGRYGHAIRDGRH